MEPKRAIPAAKDKTLFTPGPLTTSLSVKQAMLHDAGSWHFEFNQIVAEIREKLLTLAGVSREDGFEAILMQGSGTFGVEAVLATIIPPQGKLLVLSNGAYGERMLQVAACLKIDASALRTPENETPNIGELRRALTAERAISH